MGYRLPPIYHGRPTCVFAPPTHKTTARGPARRTYNQSIARQAAARGGGRQPNGKLIHPNAKLIHPNTNTRGIVTHKHQKVTPNCEKGTKRYTQPRGERKKIHPDTRAPKIVTSRRQIVTPKHHRLPRQTPARHPQHCGNTTPTHAAPRM